MSTILSAYRKVQLHSFVYVLLIYRKSPVHRNGSYQNGSSVKVTSVKDSFFLREKGISKNFSIFLNITTLKVSRFLSRESSHKQYESYQIGCFRPSLRPRFPTFHVIFVPFLCCFFLQVVHTTSNSHTKNMSLEPTCKSLPRRGLESSEYYFSNKTT